MAGGWGSAQANYQLGYQTKQGGLTAAEEAERQDLIQQILDVQQKKDQLNIERVKARGTVLHSYMSAEANLAAAGADLAASSAQTVAAVGGALEVYATQVLPQAHDALSGQRTGDYNLPEGYKKNTSPNLQIMETGLGNLHTSPDVKAKMLEVTREYSDQLKSDDPKLREKATAGVSTALIPYIDGKWNETNRNKFQLVLNSETSTEAEKFRAVAQTQKDAAEMVGSAMQAIEASGGLPPGSLTNDAVVQSVTDYMLPNAFVAVTTPGSAYQAAQEAEREAAQSETDKILKEIKGLERKYRSPALDRAAESLEAIGRGEATFLDGLGFGMIEPDTTRSEIEEYLFERKRLLDEKAKTPDPLDAAVMRMAQTPGWDQYKRLYGFKRDDEAAIWAARDPRGLNALHYVKGAQAANMTDKEMRDSLRVAGHAAEERDVGHGFRSDMRSAAAVRPLDRQKSAQVRETKRHVRQLNRERTGPEDMSQNQRDRAAAKMQRKKDRENRKENITGGADGELTDVSGRSVGVGSGASLQSEQETIANRLSQRLMGVVNQSTDSDTSTISGLHLNHKGKKVEDEVADPLSYA